MPLPNVPPPSEGWQRRWYPLAFIRDLKEHPQRVTVHGQGFALFHAGSSGWSSVLDRCPHRAARLSDGEVRDGRLSCRYHGWEFDGCGRCVQIPQALDTQPIPHKAHVSAFPVRERQGMLWLWPDAATPPGVEPPPDVEAPSNVEELADPEASLDPGASIPIIPDLDRADCTSIDFAIDLPYEQSFLIENVIDIAHIHVAHHGIRGGGHRDLAAPIDFDVSKMDLNGFSAAFRSIGLEGGSMLRGARVTFMAPNLVHYESLYENPKLRSGLALYSLPISPTRCRLLYRAYSNFWRLRDRLRPRWMEHWTQCTILEQDMDVVLGQVEEIIESGRPPRELWLPLKTSDALVIAYRKWLDQYAPQGTYRVGFDHTHGTQHRHDTQCRLDVQPTEAFDRYRMHTKLCGSCSLVHQRLLQARGPLALSVVGFLALAAATTGSAIAAPAAGMALASAAGRVLVDQIERRFRS